MLVKKNDIYSFTNFENFPKLTACISTRKFGNMKSPKFKKKFLSHLGLNEERLVSAQQVHGNKIKIVDRFLTGKKIYGVDGLITRQDNLILMVLVADCLPIFAYDPNNSIIGVVHAGWRGTLGFIAKYFIDEFIKLGSDPKKLHLALGPSIEFCHYEVGMEVADKFVKAGFEEAVLKSVSGKLYVDLKTANIKQLKESGVLAQNIDVTLKSCTYESEDFFSLRREKNNLAGEMAAIIAMKQ